MYAVIGVLPVPPTARLPTQIVGTDTAKDGKRCLSYNQCRIETPIRKRELSGMLTNDHFIHAGHDTRFGAEVLELEQQFLLVGGVVEEFE